ncbi:MAG: alanine racemase [Deltaproteobacteria bacterium]|nr:alanine racemase [Deltaproteobacteria bacterium]MBW2047752.1 alanine racemase [Deltaproteobacteria bacterium]MBW2110395.1 alanine racemase [Deltaproteobacteria bacterium]
MKIDLSALADNLRQVRNLVGRDTMIMGVVKADGYGHGLVEVARCLEKSGVDYLGTAFLHEALGLRRAGILVPVVILCGIRTREEVSAALANSLIPVLYDLEAVERVSQEAASLGKEATVHLKVDTGMGRLGIPHDEIGSVLRQTTRWTNLRIQGLVSHLSSGDEPEGRFSTDQTVRFERAISTGRKMGFDLPLNSMANSAGIMGHDGTHFNLVRPGIMLYGGLPSPDYESPVSLNPVMGFSGRVLQVRDLPPGTPVSYGRTYRTTGRRRIAVVSAGYSDGLLRTLSNRGEVLVRGKKAPIVGRVCMNLTMCDITGIERVETGDEVVFLGYQGEDCITGDDLARVAGTISYEVFCSIGTKNPREYLS